MDPILSERAECARSVARAVLDLPSHARLDALVDAAGRGLRAAGALLSAIADCQVTLNAVGAGSASARPGDERDLEDAVCTNVVRIADTLAIADARRDPRVSSLPVVRDGAVVAYLGAPVHVAGQIVAVLCVHDVVERTWTPDDTAALERHAAEAGAELERLTA